MTAGARDEATSDLLEALEVHNRIRGYLHGVVNSLNVGIIVLDERFTITLANREQGGIFARLGVPLSPLDVIGSPIAEVYPVLGPSEWDAVAETVIGSRTVATHARVGWPPERPSTYFSISVMPFSPADTAGQPLGCAVCLTEDITRLVSLEEQLVKRERQALAGGVAIALNHEINSPLTCVIGGAELLLMRKDLPPDVASRLTTIAQHAQRIAEVLKRLEKLEDVHMTEYLKDGPLMVDLHRRDHLEVE